MKKEKNDIKNHDNNSSKIKIEHGDSSQAEMNGKEISKEDLNESTKSNAALALEKELEEAKLKIEQYEKEIADYKDKLLRKAAEFENYKRRTENDQLNLLKYAAESFIIKLLPTVDDIERSLQHMDKAKDVESIKQGIQLVYDKLLKVLNDQGVTKIESAGKPFDVHYHEALMQRKVDGVEPHTVLDEIEKGYMYKDRVIRHSKVIVSEDMSSENFDSSQSNTENTNNEVK